MLALEDVSLKQTRFYQEAMTEGLEKGEQWADRFIDATTLEAIFGDFKNKI